MRDKDKVIDPLPNSFETEEKAGEFWEAHSTMDYQEYLEPSNDTIEISESVFDISQLHPKDAIRDGALEDYDKRGWVLLFRTCSAEHDHILG